MSWDNFKNLTSNQQNQASTSGGWYSFVKTTNPQILINQQKKIDKFHQGMSQTFKSAMQQKREEELRQQQIRLQNTPAFTGKQGQSLSYNQTNSQYLTRKTEQGYKDPYLQQRNLERIEYEKADTKVAERVLSNPNITREKKAMAEAVMHLNKKVDRGDKDWRIPSFGIANFVDDLTRQGIGIFTGSGQGSMDVSARYEHSDPEMRDLQAEYDALIQKQRLVNPHNPFVGFTLGLLSSGSYMIERTLAESAGWFGRSLFVLTRGVDDINERNNQFVNYDIKTNSYVVNEENIKRTNERLSNPKKLAKDLGITIGNATLQYAVESLLGQVVGGVTGLIGKKIGSTSVGQMGLARLKTSLLGKTIDKLAETKFKLAPDKSVLDVIKNFKSLAGQQGILGEQVEEEVQFVLDEITDSLINETKYEFSTMSNEERIMSILSVGVMQLAPVAGVKVFNDFSIRRIEKQVAKELKDNGYPPAKSEQTAKILVQSAIKAKQQEAEQKQQQANNTLPDDDGTGGATGAVQQQQEQQITPQPQQQVIQTIQQPQNQTEVITPQETTQKTQKGENKPVKQDSNLSEGVIGFAGNKPQPQAQGKIGSLLEAENNLKKLRQKANAHKRKGDLISTKKGIKNWKIEQNKIESELVKAESDLELLKSKKGETGKTVIEEEEPAFGFNLVDDNGDVFTPIKELGGNAFLVIDKNGKELVQYSKNPNYAIDNKGLKIVRDFTQNNKKIKDIILEKKAPDVKKQTTETKPEVNQDQEADPFETPAYMRKGKIDQTWKSEQEAETVLNKQNDVAGEYSKELSVTEKEGVGEYSFRGHKVINKALRDNKEGVLSKANKDVIKSLDSAIAKYDLKKPITVFRGAGKTETEILLGKNVGEVVTLPAFTSTTLSKRFALIFGSTRNKDNRTLIQLEVKPSKGIGADISKFSSFQTGEQEFLLKRGLEFIITSKGTVEFEGKKLPFVKGEIYDRSKDGQTKTTQGTTGKIDDGNRNENSQGIIQEGARGVSKETKQEVKPEKALVSETKAKQKQQKENNTGHDIIIQSNKKDNKPSELQKAYVEDGRMITTNLSEVLSTPTDLPNGLYVKAGSEWVKAKEQELASHFPTPVILDTTHELQISLTKNEIARLIATSAKDSVRPVLNGAHFFSTMGNLYSVSTDGFILSVHNMGETSLKEGESFTLSRQALEIMSKLNMTDVNVKLDENNQAEISSDSRTLTTRLIDGKFPPIKTIFPTSDTQITVNQADLKNALKDLKPYAKEKNHILVETTEDGLVLSAESEEFGKKEILIKIRKTEKGKEHSLFDSGFSLLMPRTKDIEKGTSKISLDPKFLERTTKNISGEEVKFGFSTPETAVAIMGTAETKPKKVTKAPKASKETQVKNPKAGASYGGFAIKQDHNWSDAKDIAELKKRASNYKTRIKTPELIAFSQILGADPTLSSKLTKKLGVFWHNDGEKGIKINKAIVNDPLLLNMVLSHEIGHLIDWLPTGFIKRSSLLTKVMTDKAQMKDMFNRVLTNKEVKEELKKLTQKRNPFDESKNENYTKYRYSAAELYAEFISELLTNPEGVKQIAPKFDKLWLENIYKKPSVQQAYLNMLNLGATGEYLQVRSENVRKTAAQAEIERENVLAAAKEQNKDILTTLAVALLRKDSAVRRDYKKAKKQSSDPSAVSNPIHALENLGHKSNIINGFKEKFIRPLSDFMSKNKLDINILHEFAMYDRIIHERGAVTNPAQLAMERMGDENWSKIEKYLPEDIFEMSATEQYATFKRVLGEKLYKDLMGYLPKDGGIANPFGFDHDSAKESRKYLEQSLGNDYVKYQEALRQVREFNKEVIEYAKKGGFYSPETIAMMEANPAYASFQVIDYVGTKLTAAVKHQTGTFKGIANTIFSTFEKNLSIINAVEINNAKQEVVKFYQESLPEDIKELGFRMGANKQKIFDKVSNSNLYGEIILYDNGVQKAYQVDKLVADIFTYNQSPVSSNFVLNSLRFMAKIPRAAFINFNIGFQISNFFFRDFQRYYRNNPFTSAFSPLKLPRQLKNYLKAIPTAYRIVKGENNASIEEMRKARVIIEDSIFNLETRLKEIPDSRVKMQKAFEARFGMENSKDANLLVKMFAPFFNAFTATGEIAETIPKVAGYLEYQDYKKRLGSKAKFNDQEAFAIIRNRLGSPNYQNKAGLNAEASSIMLFYNAIKEGILSDIEAVMDKKTRVNTLVNIGVLLLPAIYNIMQGMGEMGDEDKELMDSISEYDKRNYNILLLGRAKNGKAIYLRLPLSDSERTLRAIAYEMASKGEGDDFHDYVKSMSSVFTTVTEAVPGFNPVLKSLFDTKTYLSGENIWDSFYQDTVFTEEEMAVGGEQKLMKFLKYIGKNMGGNLVMSKSEKTVGEKEPIQKIVEEKVLFGILGRFIRYTSSGDEETLRNLSEKEKQEQLRQTAREKQAVKQEVEKYKAGELTLNEAKKQAIKQVLGDDFSELGRYDEEQKATLKRVESRFLRESVAPEYEKKLKAVYYTSKKDAKIKVLIKSMEKMSKEEVREMLKEGTRTGLISQPVSDEAWREFNKQSQ